MKSFSLLDSEIELPDNLIQIKAESKMIFT